MTKTPTPQAMELIEAIDLARDIMRRREGLILVLTGYEREQKKAENFCLETLITAATEAARLREALKEIAYAKTEGKPHYLIVFEFSIIALAALAPPKASAQTEEK